MKKLKSLISQNKEISIIVSMFILVNLFKIIQYHELSWDEAVYLGIGKYLYSAGSAGLYEPIRPLLLPLILGAWWLVNLPAVFMAKLTALAFSSATLVALYAYTRKIIDQQTAWIATLILAITPVFFLHATDVLTEIPSLLFTLLAFYFVNKKNYKLTGVCIAFSFLTKFPNALLVAVMGIYLIITQKSKKNLITTATYGILTTIPFFIFNVIKRGNPIDPLLLGSLHSQNLAYQIMDPVMDNLFYIIKPIQDHPIFLLSFLGILLLIANKQIKQKPLALLSTFTATYLVYFSTIPNKQIRFFLIFIPLFPILAAYTITSVFKLGQKTRQYSFAIIFTILIVASSALTIQQNAHTFTDYKQEHSKQEIFDRLSNHPTENPILTTDPIVAAYTDKSFIPFYFFVYDEHNATHVYHKEKKNAELIVFTPEVFACERYDDNGCSIMVSDLSEEFEKNHEKIYEKKVGWETFKIYKITSS